MATDTRSELQDFQKFLANQLAKEGPVPSLEACTQLWRERSEVLAAVHEGLADVEAGRTQPLDDFLDELHAWQHVDAR
jgi:predicted transcriptional regulator